jgi:2,4-dienoyl-CoA reductase-like NADH-dependent reductase (Old Yellow Enzyme family)
MTQAAVSALFRPFRLKSLELSNRFVMAPMTRTFSPNGVPGDDVAAYYRRRAEGGVGLILSEGTVIARPASRNHPRIPFFHGEAALAGWQRVIKGVHAAGGKMGPQIWHTGGAVLANEPWTPDAPVETPSGINGPGDPRGKAMTEEDIADTIAAFARAAADAQRLGFDVVELHGAHGYLIDQFFWSGTNQRTDRFGGKTLAERARFAVDVVKAVRDAVGPTLPLLLRISQFKQQDYKAKLAEDPRALEAWLAPLAAAGVDVFHCSQRRFWEPEFPTVDGAQGKNFAGWVKEVTNTATITVGSVGLSGDFLGAFGGQASQPTGLEELVRRFERNEFDLVAVGRALLSDPRWVSKVKAGEALDAFEPAAMGALA